MIKPPLLYHLAYKWPWIFRQNSNDDQRKKNISNENIVTLYNQYILEYKELSLN